MRRNIGTTGIEVNAIGLGAWQLSNVNRPGQADAFEVIRLAVDAGVDLIDTADSYSYDQSDFGHNEILVREALHTLGLTDRVMVATKVGLTRPNLEDWVPDGRPEYVTAGCHASLERLGVNTITLYQLHKPDPRVPIEDTVGAMADLQAAGKVVHIGLSNVSMDELERSRTVARIETVQNRCNARVRDDLDNGLIEHCRREGISYLPWHPVGGEKGHGSLAQHPTLVEMGERLGVSTYRLLLRWLLSLGDHVLPIPGATRSSSILDSLLAPEVEIEAADLETIGTLG